MDRIPWVRLQEYLVEIAVSNDVKIEHSRDELKEERELKELLIEFVKIRKTELNKELEAKKNG